MARLSNITFGQVAQIADTLKAAGTRPTARAVRERIGSGSMGTIHKLLQQWQGKAGAEDDESEASALPDHIQKALMDFIGTEIATACEPINDELQEAKEALDSIAQDNERVHATLDTVSDELDRTRQDRVAATAQLNMSRDELKNANKAREEIGEKYTELLRDLDRAQRKIEMLANYQLDLAKAQTALAESNAARIEAERTAAVLHAQLVAEANKANELSERMKTAESRASSKDEELKQANNHYQACAARLEAAAREIESLRKPKPAAQPKAKPTTAKKTTGQSKNAE